MDLPNIFLNKNTTPKNSPLVPKIHFKQPVGNNNNLGLSFIIYDKFQRDIHQAIRDFNAAGSTPDKITALKKMQAAIQHVDLHTPPRTLASAQGFHDAKNALFTQIKAAYAENAILTLSQPGKAGIPIARILSDMAPEKADRLMEILHKGASITLNAKLRALYPSDDTFLEANQWRDFLRDHTIEFLGGGNSKNFKVTNNANGSVKVLKVDNRLGMPRHVEQHLRGKLGDVFTPIDADRQVKGIGPYGTTVSRTLLVTDLCTSGSVDEHSTKVRGKGQTETYLAASEIMGQMSQVFMDIQKAKCCFPDSKLTNWLVDANGKIRLADTKSFVFTNDKGLYSLDVSGNENTSVLYTQGFTPTEINNSSFNAEKLHASLLGRNIYAYLTGKWPSSDRLNSLDEPIFKSTMGKEYKQLIQQLVQDPASSRLSLREAQAKLGYNKIIIKAKNFSASAGVELRSFVENTLKADMTKPGYSKIDSIIKIDVSLDQLKASSDKCDQLIKQISSIKIGDKSFINKAAALLVEKDAAMQGATSIDDLKGKLDVFKIKLQKNMTELEKIAEYQKIKDKLEHLKICKDDPQMDQYLAACDGAIMKGGKPDDALINAQMEKMEQVITGLKSPENQKVQDIITKYDIEKKYLLSRNMNVKARKIEAAMASIPIEERVNLLQSKHKGVTELLSALAWHRTNFFANPVNKKGQINAASSSSTFKEFKERFKEKIAKREDVAIEEEKKPKYTFKPP